MEEARVRSRRRHAALLKEQVLAECSEAGSSVAAVALARGLNTNLVHKWRRQANGARHAVAAPVAHQTFIPVGVAASAPSVAADIRIELRRGAVAINVSWPREAAADCAAWLREFLR